MMILTNCRPTVKSCAVRLADDVVAVAAANVTQAKLRVLFQPRGIPDANAPRPALARVAMTEMDRSAFDPMATANQAMMQPTSPMHHAPAGNQGAQRVMKGTIVAPARHDAVVAVAQTGRPVHDAGPRPTVRVDPLHRAAPRDRPMSKVQLRIRLTMLLSAQTETKTKLWVAMDNTVAFLRGLTPSHR